MRNTILPYRQGRLTISLIMLVLAFISLILINVRPTAYWIFTNIMVVVDALLSIGWGIYLRRYEEERLFVAHTWHMVLHWVGLIAIVCLLTLFVHYDFITLKQAGLFNWIALALTLYLAGIYTDVVFIGVGIVLAILSLGAVLIAPYFWLVVTCAIIITAGIVFLVMRRKSHEL